MGILAPLELEKENPMEQIWASGQDPVKIGVWFLFFGGILFLMDLAIAPFLRDPRFQDPWLSAYLSPLLKGLGVLVFLIALGLLGYKKRLILRGQRQQIDIRECLWTLPVRKREIPFADILDWQIKNIRPQRMEAQNTPLRKKEGYWEVRLRTRSQVNLLLDRTPDEEELRTFVDKVRTFCKNFSVQQKRDG